MYLTRRRECRERRTTVESHRTTFRVRRPGPAARRYGGEFYSSSVPYVIREREREKGGRHTMLFVRVPLGNTACVYVYLYVYMGHGTRYGEAL